jgi:hypothetical protein
MGETIEAGLGRTGMIPPEAAAMPFDAAVEVDAIVAGL